MSETEKTREFEGGRNVFIDEKKRKLEQELPDGNKKVRVCCSLGLSLLRTYDEEENEDDLTATNSLIDVEEKDHNLSSYIVEEEEEVSSIVFSSVAEKVETENSESIYEVELQEDLENLSDSVITAEVDEFNERDIDFEEDRNSIKADTKSAVMSVQSSRNTDIQKDNYDVKEVVNLNLDYNFSVFGRTDTGSDGSSGDVGEVKPVRRIKLNRSKFIKAKSESKNHTQVLTKVNSENSFQDLETGARNDCVEIGYCESSNNASLKQITKGIMETAHLPNIEANSKISKSIEETKHEEGLKLPRKSLLVPCLQVDKLKEVTDFDKEIQLCLKSPSEHPSEVDNFVEKTDHGQVLNLFGKSPNVPISQIDNFMDEIDHDEELKSYKKSPSSSLPQVHNFVDEKDHDNELQSCKKCPSADASSQVSNFVKETDHNDELKLTRETSQLSPSEIDNLVEETDQLFPEVIQKDEDLHISIESMTLSRDNKSPRVELGGEAGISTREKSVDGSEFSRKSNVNVESEIHEKLEDHEETEEHYEEEKGVIETETHEKLSNDDLEMSEVSTGTIIEQENNNEKTLLSFSIRSLYEKDCDNVEYQRDSAESEVVEVQVEDTNYKRNPKKDAFVSKEGKDVLEQKMKEVHSEIGDVNKAEETANHVLIREQEEFLEEKIVNIPEECVQKEVTSDEEIFEDAVEEIHTVEATTLAESTSVNVMSPSIPSEQFVFSQRLEPSKLEQALTGRLESSHPVKYDVPFQSKFKEQHYDTLCSLFQEKDWPSTTAFEGPNVETEKQNIKLHFSLQGDRISIRSKSLPTVTPSGRVKRTYRKRAKHLKDLQAEQATAKEYANRLRQRTERETPGAKRRGPKGRKKKDKDIDSQNQTVKISDGPNLNLMNVSSLDEVAKSPITIEIEKRLNMRSESSMPGKVQPIKLKINKNSNVTIECSSYTPLTVGKVQDSNVNSSVKVEKTEEARPRHSEQAIIAPWSAPEFQTMERLLRESNITITPVSTSSHPTIVKPILCTASSSTTSPTHSIRSQQKKTTENTFAMSASVTPIKQTKFPHGPIVHQSRPFNISIKPITQNIRRTQEAAVPDNLNFPCATKMIDVKEEIRKKITSTERWKNEASYEAEPVRLLETSFKMEKIMPGLLPINTPTVESVGVETTPPLIQTAYSEYQLENIVTASGTSAVSTPMAAVSLPTTPFSGVSMSQLATELFPKKRGRPTKAMVAAREAFRQKQEEIEQMKIHHQMQGVMWEGSEAEKAAAKMQLSIPDIMMTPTDPAKYKRHRKSKMDRSDKKTEGEDDTIQEFILESEREAEEQKRIEEERIRKEEERERKNEIRRLKAKERSDLVKEKRLRQKMKAKERHKMAKELRRKQMEEKKKLEEQLKRLPMTGFDDETRMSADNSEATHFSYSTGMIDDDSSGLTNEASQKVKKSRLEVTDVDSHDLMIEQIAEYQWPIQGGELYMIQEQVSNVLGVKSFKRKYPDIKRRPVDLEERAYLVDSGLVSETLCDLGITAVRSAEVLDIMCSDFPLKYEEFRRYTREKQMKELSFKQKAWANGLGYKLLMADGSKQDLKKRAMESASNWNSALNKSRVEERRGHMDLQTFIIHFPKNKNTKMSIPSSKIGSYPVSILPGQFCDYYKEYTPTELRYLPLNTVLYGPLKHQVIAEYGDGSQIDSDDSTSSDDSSTTSEDTEEMLEDIDKDMLLDETNVKFNPTLDSKFSDDKMQSITSSEITNGVTENMTPTSEGLKSLCKICLGDQLRNKQNVSEVLIRCSQCSSNSHPTCLDLSLNMVPQIKSYYWQCPDCKSCAKCKENTDEDKMLFCDTCDRGFHIYCVGLKKVPSGNWQCHECNGEETAVAITSGNIPDSNMSGLIEITS